MPIIRFEGQTIQAAAGQTLRQALHEAGCSPHNGSSRWFNCKGLGSCGTCAVEVLGGPTPALTRMERWRLSFPPHEAAPGLRLACQLQLVEGQALQVRKHEGFWGHHVGRLRAPDSPSGEPDGESDGESGAPDAQDVQDAQDAPRAKAKHDGEQV